ncbi:MAG: TonB family protein [Elusimicrobia bacterium]|nr:TonB family protein [Elusimicrobiota bacterium]
MAEARIPTSVLVSVGLHGGLLVFFGLMMREAPKQASKVVDGVDLLISAPKPRAAQAAAPKPPPLSTFDFLKLALPTAPHSAAPAQLSVKIPEHKLALAEAPKLEDRAKRNLGPKLQALDLSEHPVDMAKLDVKITRRQAAATLAALPRLEEVGRRRIKNLPQALELEDRRREAVAVAGLPEMSVKTPSRRQALAAVSALQEAAPEERPERKGLGSLLPEKPILMEARPQAAMAPKLEKIAAIAPRLERRQAQQAGAAKKGIEIEGPLADRKVAAYAVPPFPDWAKNQGILEADVAIRFTVDEDGAVMPGMRVENSSGYGRIDKLAMESLKSWRFVPKPGAGVQWGVITFRFILE